MSFSSRGFTLMEMIVVILVTAILMAMAAPLIVHLVDGYEADAQGADAISATGPALWRMQWDARAALSIALSKKISGGCYSEFTATEPAAARVTTVVYQYQGGALLRNGSIALSQLQSSCPFSPSGLPSTVLYRFVYAGANGLGRLPIAGAVSAYGY